LQEFNTAGQASKIKKVPTTAIARYARATLTPAA
jgi:hypothetical protein